MANRFLNNIRINDEYTFPANDGSAGQAIITDGSGNLSFGSAVASSADSTESIHISVKNTSGSQILKGTPVYVTGETGNSGKIEIAPADASDSAKMPALGILESTLNDNAEGFCVQGGLLEGLATATIDGTSTTANDTVYVKAGGGLTMTKPTGSNLIQNIAKVARVHASNGSLVVSSILRTNDVPNLTTGKIWVGDDNTTESTVVHLDETNGRMGIGTTSPTSLLHVLGSPVSTSGALITARNNNATSSNTTFGGIMFNSLPGTDYSIGKSNVNTATTLSFRNANTGVSYMDINSSGNVGIGISSGMTYPLTVQAASGNNSYIHFVNSTTGTSFSDGFQIGVPDGGSDALLFQREAANMKFYTSATERMRIDSSGNVGIGTTSPSQKLDVSGNIKMTETAATSDTDKFVVLDSGVLKYRTGSQIVSDLPTDGRYVAVAGDTMTGDLILGSNQVNFKTNGSSTSPNFFGHRSAVDLDTRFTSSEGGWSYTTFDSSSSNNPGGSLHNANGLLSFNTHSGNYGHQIAMTTNTAKLYFRTRNNSSWQSWQQVFTDAYHPNADKWTTARTITLGGDLTGSVTLDGSANVTLSAQVVNNSHTHDDRYVELTGDTMTGNLEISKSSAKLILTDSGTGQASVDVRNSSLYARWILDTDDLFRVYNQTSGFDAFAIKSSGNVGIGTTSPDVKLEVAGTLRLHDGTDQGRIFFRNDRDDVYIQESNYQLVFGAPSGMVFELDTNNNDNDYFNVTHRGSSRMYINGPTGNVGIGTTSPNEKLSVNGTFSSNAFWTNSSAITSWGPYPTAYGVLTWDSGYAKVYATSGKELHLGANGSGADVVIDTSGNVGIGTASPAGKLEVNTGSDAAYFTRTAGDDGLLNPVVAIAADSSRGLIAASGDSLTFRVRATGTSNPFGGTSVMSLLPSGNVGIGTTSPDSLFTIHKDNTSGQFATYRNNTGFFLHRTYADYNNDGTTVEYQERVGVDGNYTRIGNFSNHPLYLMNNNSTKVSILTSGNVGIGTTSPGAKLEVNGNIAINAGQKIQLSGSADSTHHIYHDATTDYDKINYSSGFQLEHHTSGIQMTLVGSGGNVGIGTTSPGAKLHIEGDGSIIRLQNNSSDANGTFIDFRDSTGARTGYVGTTGTSDDMFLFTQGAKPIRFYTNASERMHINSSGNVGIGTTSPASILHVEGGSPTTNLIASSGNGFLRIADSATSATRKEFTILLDNANNRVDMQAIQQGVAARNITLNASGGNVGIGTTSPGYKLDVEGSLNINANATNGIRFEDDGNYTTLNADAVLRINQRVEVWGGGASGNSYLDVRNSSGTQMVKLEGNGGASYFVNNVGIGTTSPSEKLHVAGNMRLQNQLYDSTNSQGTFNDVLTKVSAGTEWKSISDLPIDSRYVAVTGDTMTGLLIAEDGIRIGSGNHYTDGRASLTFGEGSPTNDSMYIEYDGENLNGDNNAIFIGSNKAGVGDVLSVTYGGNVGIGVTDPDAALDVSGNIKMTETAATSDTDKFVVSDSGVLKYRTGAEIRDDIDAIGGSGTGGTIALFTASGTDLGDSIITQSSQPDKITIGGQLSLQGSGDVLNISHYSGSAWFIDTSTGDDIFFGAPATNTQNVGVQGDLYAYNGDLGTKSLGSFNNKISISGDSYFNAGDVGIGTTAPAATLHANVTGNNTVFRFTRDTGTNGRLDLDFDGATSNFNSLYDYTFQTDGTERMRIDSATGNVGIGTDNPGKLLELSGGANVAAIRLRDTGSNVWDIQNSTFGKLDFIRGATNVYMRIDQFGNVGINETNPTALLNIGDDANESDLTATGNYAINTGGAIITRHHKHANLESPEMEWSIGGSTDLNWKKLATIVIGDANYAGFGAEIEITDFSGNYGNSVAQYGDVYRGGLSIRHRDGTGSEPKDAVISIHSDMVSHIRVYKIPGSGNSSYQIQVKSPANYRQLYIKLKGGIGNQVLDIIPHANDTDGSTSGGTAYTPLAYTNEAQFKTGFTAMSTNRAVVLHRLSVGVTSAVGALDVKTDASFGNCRIIIPETTNQNPVLAFYRPTGSAQTVYPWWFEANGSSFHIKTGSAANIGSESVSAKVTINSSGNVGIGQTNPSTYKLDVSGTIRATGDVIAYSDIRVKENISTIENALDKVKKLRGVEYNKIDNPERSIGVIAQEIEDVLPEVVKEDNEGMKSVAYGNITAVLIEAIKEQQKQIDELKNQLDAFTK